ncbi:MAG: hypothetical protein HUU38_18950, partial [Anaerolineales bacterium]|nr:hypothetical protein [Anaerolineales bacterium]
LDLILLFGFLASSLGLGAIILRQVGPSFVSPLERILFATGIGLAVFAYATAGLAAAGGLYPTVARTLYGFGLLIGIMQANRLVFPSLRSLSRLEVILITFLFTFAILALVGVLSPPTDWDSLMYHLEVPKRYIQAHGYVYIPNGYANFPQFIESLYAFAMLVHGDILARLVNLTFGGRYSNGNRQNPIGGYTNPCNYGNTRVYSNSCSLFNFRSRRYADTSCRKI